MKGKIFCVTTALLLFFAAYAGSAENITPQVGSVFPSIKLTKPTDAAHLKYLGLSGDGTFKLNRIKADVLIIEIFSIYCPYCQAEAPSINELYRVIENNPALKNKIKMIGIGIGNSAFEADIFKKKYQVDFPLFPDGDFKLHKIIGEVRTPYFFVVKLKSGTAEAIYSQLGALGDHKLFLDQIIKSAGLK